jgi:ElaB/YqjD/DUF883 family membrane-anchored ribosome-binding protein
MADKAATIEAAAECEDVGGETKAGLMARIEHLKRALADSRLGQKAREVGSQVDQSVHEKPYHYIAGAAVVGALVGLVAGMLIARRRD